MKFFADTFFLHPVYRPQDKSSRADAIIEEMGTMPIVSGLMLFEFRQSVRLQMRLHRNDKTKGFSKPEGTRMLRDLQRDISRELLIPSPVDWPDVHQTAERLSATHTTEHGHRFADILHVATALHLGCERFLTFDENQSRLAEAEGMEIIEPG
jgi:predicted nucleic acid-binding protein